MTAALDPVLAHVAELDRVLRGPAAAKRSMIAEVRDGLHDAVAAHREGGLDPERAAAAAVREFGEVREIAPLLQEELTLLQGRRTATLVAVAFPTMLLAWDGLWTLGHGWSAPPPPVTAFLARAVDVATVLVAAAALAVLVATLRRRAAPRRISRLTGSLAAGGVLATGGLSVVMNLLSPEGVATFVPHPLGGIVTAGSVVVAVLVIASAVRALELARYPD